MKNRLLSCVTASMLLCGVPFASLAAAGEGGNGAGYTAADQEFYLTETQVAFIRPGLVVEVVDVTIPSDLLPEVTFMLTDPAGLPLDSSGVFTPGSVSTSFILGYIPQGEEAYVSYTTRVQTSPITGDSAEQASADSGGTYTEMGDGTYLYKFGTALPGDYDADATHTLGIYASRNLSEFDLGTYYDNALEHFVPSGSGDPVPRDITSTATCNNCHDTLGLHGGSRQEVGLCVLCHNPTQGIDPDTGDSVDMPHMTHKIHAGVNLDNGYTIIGFRQAVHDYSHVVFPTEINDCQVCHVGGTPTADVPLVANPNPIATCDGKGTGITELNWLADGPIELRLDSADGKIFAKAPGDGSKETGNWVRQGKEFFLVDSATGETLDRQKVDLTVFGCVTNPPYAYPGVTASQHDKWMTNPNRVACGACHDAIDWETGEGHVGGPQEDDQFCSFCHQADSGVEFDRSVRGAHKVVLASTDMTGVLVKIKQVTNTGPGQSPTVRFALFDKNGPLSPAELETFTLTLNGPNDDFEVNIRENAMGKLTPVGSDWSYTFAGRIPMDAEGSYSVGYEGRITRDVNGDGATERDSAENALFAVAVTDDAAVSRRMVVDDAKCEACHSNLSLHGDNRKNATEYCQTCHNPEETDAVVRTEGEPESIHFKYMIHKIHRGAELENLPYIVYGFRSSVHDYSEVVFPGDLRNCEACHVEGSYGLPLPEGALPTHSPAAVIPEMEPITATCLSCHDGDATASHALANTSALGESCSTCHGDDKTYSVERVHSR
jgi:hypothetical protein